MSEQQPESASRKCVICGKPQSLDFQPFCSKRCADIDLGRWLKEGYSIRGGEPPPEDGGGDNSA
jgi:uncharacterized protein